MSKTQNNGLKRTFSGFSAVVAFLAMAIALVAGIMIYKNVFGAPSNFVDNDPSGEPLEGNLLGVIYKGGLSYRDWETDRKSVV